MVFLCSAYNNNCIKNITGTLLCQWNGKHEYALTNQGYNFGMDAIWQYLSQFDRKTNYVGQNSSGNDNTYVNTNTGAPTADFNVSIGHGNGDNSNQLSQGGILMIAIVIGCVVVVSCCVGAWFYLQRKRKIGRYTALEMPQVT